MNGIGTGVQAIRSAVFIAEMYLAMALFALFWTPLALWRADMAVRAIHAYCRHVRRSAALIAGLRSEVRGAVPQGDVLVAAKHQSFFDILILCSVLPRPRFVMKKELVRAPIVGWYARRIGCVAVDRGRRGQAVRSMLDAARQGSGSGSQLVIYPQGTRVAPGVRRDYKPGTGALYETLGTPCVPAATNVGMFWPRHGLMRKPGLAVVEFLAPIPPGMATKPFMEELERVVEAASDELMAEAGLATGKGPRAAG